MMRKPNESGSPAGAAAPWHALTLADAFGRLSSSGDGLSHEEAVRRLARHGPNRLTPPTQRGPLARFALQFHNVLIYVLLVAAAVTAALGHYIDMSVILAVVLINAVIGFLQEGRAERAMDAVRRMLSLQATVVRAGQRRALPAEDLVPGDVIVLQSGDKVPADCRLVRVKSLAVDEAALTGESTPVEKAADAVPADAPLADRISMAYAGSIVTYGQATALVVATGDRTEIGRISGLLAKVETLTTPLLRQMRRFGHWLSLAILIIAALVFVFGILVRGMPPAEMFMFAVGVAVAMIPEGLPAIMTIVLAIGVERMARAKAIVRRLPAVEALGSVTVICSDKTGTLTRNELTLREVRFAGARYEVTGSGYAPRGAFLRDAREVDPNAEPRLAELLRAAMLCNDAKLVQEGESWRVEGDPTEGALLVAGLKAGLDRAREAAAMPRLDEIPFESQHRFMATLHREHAGNGLIVVKGAPERMLELAVRQRAGDGIGSEPIEREHWAEQAEAMAAQGQRVLAIALKPAAPKQSELALSEVAGLTLLGLVGLIDAPRGEAVAAIADCHSAGIDVKMITGDHPTTARRIAEELGLASGDGVLTGRDLDRIAPAELGERVASTTVFARTSPEHKLRLVEALQAKGQVVAMTGDGVNDAPALKRADIGVAMGIKGSEAAKEAAMMVLADDNFATIARAVREGRRVYDNLKKTILWTVPTNGGEGLAIVAALLLGGEMPITATQILWINLVTAVTLGFALAFEPAEPDIMRRRPRRPDEPLLSRHLVWRVVFVSGLMSFATLSMFLWYRQRGASLEEARAVAVNTLVACEAWYLVNTRFLTATSIRPRALLGNVYVPAMMLLVFALQLAFTHLPVMQRIFHSAPLGVLTWIEIFCVGLVMFLVVEAEKAATRGINRRAAAQRR